MLKFLRYNGRHRIFFPRGYLGKHWPQLDPISSSSHGADGKRTIDFHETLWFFRLRQRIFCHAGRQRCSQRDQMGAFNRNDSKAPDTWDRGPDGFRTCSYCGSIHFDDLMEICDRTLQGIEGYGVEATDKDYKLYVKQPGVRNAGEGAIKYYKNHSPKHISEPEHEMFRNALKKTHERFEAMLKEMRDEKNPNKA